MIKLETIVLTNNIVAPFQNLQKKLNFIELNKLNTTLCLAEHGIGFLINVYDLDNLDDQWAPKLVKKIIFDTGGTNLTYLHNLDIWGFNINDADNIVLSHWHYDHTGGFYKILEKIKNNILIICHSDALYERFFKRSDIIKNSDLEGKTRQEILPLLSTSKLVNQEPFDVERIKKLKGKIFYSKNPYELLNIKEGLKIIASGEIPRKHKEEDFDNFFSLQDGILKVDKILDDKCLILEFEDRVILLVGCCHSGIMNTLDYVKKITNNKPITHIIGGFHMANASDQRIKSTIRYLKTFQEYREPLFLFPIHCSGERFIQEINKSRILNIKAFSCSVGTQFNFKTTKF